MTDIWQPHPSIVFYRMRTTAEFSIDSPTKTNDKAGKPEMVAVAIQTEEANTKPSRKEQL